MQKGFTKKQKQILSVSRKITVLLFCTLMGIGTLGGLLWFARPSQSTLEKRELTAFPSFSLSSFLDGSWFSQVSLWYSDTYPSRDRLLAMNMDIEKLKGIQMGEQILGTARQGDEIGAGSSQAEQDKTTAAEEAQFDTRSTIPDQNTIAEDIEGQLMDGILLKDGAAYGVYWFLENSYQIYTQALERAAKELEGTTNVYSILVPNNSGVMLDEATYAKLGGSDQKQAIDYYYTNYSDLIHPVGTIDTLREHTDEDLYFRTDHHWTPLAAYYVYRNFCEVKGFEPVDKETLEHIHFEPFLGSYYSEYPNMDFTPDVFDAWVPAATNTARVYTQEIGNPDSENYYEAPVVNTSPDLDEYSQYVRLISGDQPFEVIDNPEIEDGTSCLVVKESYGNALVPWLVSHYDKVYVMDFRYNDMPIVTWCRDHGVTDLIMINNIQLAATESVAQRYDALLN